MEKNQILV